MPRLIISDHSTSTTLPWEGSLYQRRPASVTPSEGSSTFGNEINGFFKSEDLNEIHNSEAVISYMTDEEKNKNFREFILWQQQGLDIEKLNCLLINFGVNTGAGHQLNLLQIRLVQLFFPNRIFCFTRECHNSYKAERTGITLGYIYIEIHVHLTVQRVYVRVLCTDQTALGYLRVLLSEIKEFIEIIIQINEC